ncbi:SNARE domain [Trypanosoma vivax]|uniref:Putative syntaxin n=1 Tax=Trypanosoma vivax (strain Y486) TaxID=1055687 RepID=G0U3G2_TRYVY|nr:putative syntaxin [Trypanosoma vivax]KAH8614024.1 SNARE domain [Trypanosoma vivax]CCC50819.1 putative syntaxin [Trypanosoma vivax Y486]
MARRDRTSEFLQYRGVREKDVDSQSLLEHQHTFVEITPLWIQKLESVREVEHNIREKMEELDSLRKSHLKIEFSSSRDEREEEVLIDRAQDAVDNLFKQGERYVTELDLAFLRDLPDSGTDTELSILRNVKMCLINELGALSKTYRECQRRYLTDLKKQRAVTQKWGESDRQREIEQQLQTDAVMDHYLQKGMALEQVETILLNQQMVNERVKEFDRIYASMKSMHEMFTDMKTLVIEQGAVLDRIDYNMTVTHTRVQSAKAELQSAAEYEEGGMFKKCIFILIALIVILLVSLLVKIIMRH